jgi:hypothetical protein
LLQRLFCLDVPEINQHNTNMLRRSMRDRITNSFDIRTPYFPGIPAAAGRFPPGTHALRR